MAQALVQVPLSCWIHDECPSGSLSAQMAGDHGLWGGEPKPEEGQSLNSSGSHLFPGAPSETVIGLAFALVIEEMHEIEGVVGVGVSTKGFVAVVATVAVAGIVVAVGIGSVAVVVAEEVVVVVGVASVVAVVAGSEFAVGTGSAAAGPGAVAGDSGRAVGVG